MAPHAGDSTAPELLPGHSQGDLQDVQLPGCVQPLLAPCRLSRAVKLIDFPTLRLSCVLGKKTRLEERTEVHLGTAEAIGRK